MRIPKYNNEQVKQYISESESWRQVCLKLGLKYAGGNVQRLKKVAETYDIDYSHFKGRGWNLGGEAKNAVPLSKCLVNGVFIKPSSLKNKMLKAGMIDYFCSDCGVGDEWNGKMLVLELDHIDGDPMNNQQSNLRLLCPNCHSQTATFRGRKL